MTAPIVFLTDFGTTDPYVGQMHLVAAARAPGVPITDLCHDVAPQDVREGAFVLGHCLRLLPPGAVVCAVVDPGVGTDRAAVAVRARRPDAPPEGHPIHAIGPDNGLLEPLLALPGAEVRILDNPDLRVEPVSATFHGRDVFTPAAAHLAAGGSFESVGPAGNPGACVRRPDDGPVREEGALVGRVIRSDRFGNLVTDLPGAAVRASAEPPPVAVCAAGDDSWLGLPWARTYGEVAEGALTALLGSWDTVELAVRGGSAARELERHGIGRGSRVRLEV